MNRHKKVVRGDTEEVSTFLVILVGFNWIVYLAGLPIFLKDIFYFPGWITSLLGFLYFAYFLIEVGFLKIFYNPRTDLI